MRTLYGSVDLHPARFRNPVVTLGVFDGLHRGHRAVLARTRELAARVNGEVVVLTFDVHPRKVTTGEPPPLITSLAHRLLLLGREGADATVVLQFDQQLRTTSARQFVEQVLLAGIGAQGVVVGHDTHFGLDREGDHALLDEMLSPLGIPVERTEPVTLRDGTVVSSSAIRRAVAGGDLEMAARLLGRPPALFGTVVDGEGRGRALGFATANLDMRHELRPGRGVYAGKVRIDGRTWPAVVNIGGRPTFHPEGVDADTVEVHICGFEGDLYGRDVEVTLFDHLRPERRFDGPDALRTQIARDVMTTLERVRTGAWSLN